jgi:CubicO group peptidase (beta-lactamase class C family)
MTVPPRGRKTDTPQAGPEALVTREIEAGSLPGLVVQVRRGGRRVCSLVKGRRRPAPAAEPKTEDTLFDLASLTKPLATALMALRLADRGALNLDSAVSAFFPRIASSLGRVTVRQLLLHSAGLVPDPDLKHEFPDAGNIDRDRAVRRLLSLKPGCEPGTRVVYSCSGYLILGLVLERVTGQRLRSLFAELVAGPAGIGDLFFNPPAALQPRIAPSEDCPWRKRTLRGEVHDENACCLGGDAGNAGLFGTAAAVSSLLSLVAGPGRPGRPGRGSLLSARSRELMTRCQTGGLNSRRSAGFLMQEEDSPAGSLFSADSFGHTGFTGTSVWVEPRKDLQVVCLSSRLQLGREATADRIRRFRPKLHTAVYRAFA